MLFDHLSKLELRGGARKDALEDVPRTVPRVASDVIEWIDAINGGAPPLSRFEIAGPFNEAVMAGNLPLRAGRSLRWDAKAMQSPDVDVAPFVDRAPRSGWEFA